MAKLLPFLALIVIAVAVSGQNSKNTWTKLADMPSPAMHYGVAMATGRSPGDTSNIYLYGKPYDDWQNYMYQFNTETNTWTALSTDAVGGTGIKARWFEKGLFLRNGKFWVFGGIQFAGINGAGIPYGDILDTLIEYDFGTNKVKAVGGDSPAISTRQSPAIEQIADNQLLVFAGCHGGGNYGDTWTYTINTDTWTRLTPTIIIPPPPSANITVPTSLSGRCGHSTVFFPSRNEILMFGGHFGGGFLGDLWSFNITTSTWTYIIPDGAAAPTGRCYHAATALGEDLMVIFGGDTADIEHSNELWAFSRSFNRWVLLSSPILLKPLPRSHTAGVTVNQDKIYIFGGMGHEENGNNMFLNDLWRYQLGCSNDCSGQGTCAQFICVCNDCWGGVDCSVNTCEPEKLEKVVETKKVLLGTILAIVFSVLFVVLLTAGVTFYIMRRFKQFKRMKQATELATVKK